MKINEVEALVGITKKNIRFYEEQGLLSPKRNSENSYRDYADEEVQTLQRIKLMRKLGVPIEDIRIMLTGSHTVAGFAIEESMNTAPSRILMIFFKLTPCNLRNRWMQVLKGRLIQSHP